jgi:hypothetical protein
MPLTPELFRALGALCDTPDPAHARLAGTLGLPGRPDAADHTELFVLQLVPYASAYLSPDGMLGGEAADRVAGFWRALSLAPPTEPDHLAALLGLYAAIADRELAEPDATRAWPWRHARRALLWEHLLTWLPPYLTAAADTAAPFYAAWARLLDEVLTAEAATLPAPPVRPLHLRDRPDPPRPDAGLDAFVRGVLAPGRSGLLLTRADLARGAEETGLGLRVGDRAFVLRSMISQDTAPTIRWLATHAARWARRHRAAEPVLGDVARVWAGRAEATERELRNAQRTVMEMAHAH